MTQRVEFHYDFGSPNAYLAHLLIAGVEQRNNVSFDYFPVLLGGIFNITGNVPPIVATDKVPNKRNYLLLEIKRFVVKHQLVSEFNFNPHFPVNTVNLMRGAIVAQQLGSDIYRNYINSVFYALWRDQHKMDDPEVVAQVLNQVKLPVEQIMQNWKSPDIKQQLIDNTARSVEMGSFGSPSFYLNDELFFGKESLVDVELALG